MRRYLADPRCPHRKGPWGTNEIQDIRKWAVRFLQEDRSGKAAAQSGVRNRTDGEAGGDEDSLRLARADKQVGIQLKIERKAKLIVERMVLEKKYVQRDEHEASTAKKFLAIKIGLQQTAKALRQRLADENDPQRVEAMLTDAFRSLLNQGFINASHDQHPHS